MKTRFGKKGMALFWLWMSLNISVIVWGICLIVKHLKN